MSNSIQLLINGKPHRLDVDPARSLLWILRDVLGLTGAKYGCGEGQCGACTVLLDGRATRSCLLPVSSAAAKSITTIEGLAKGDALHPLQQAFIDAGAMQCGYCTPGMILAGVALLERFPNPTPAQIVREMDGVICRCGTYPRIVGAIREAAAARKGDAR